MIIIKGLISAGKLKQIKPTDLVSFFSLIMNVKIVQEELLNHL